LSEFSIPKDIEQTRPCKVNEVQPAGLVSSERRLDLTQISGSNVLITGGASGIGRILARKMVARGARVAIWDIDGERLCDVVDDLNRAHACRAFGYVCDVSDRASVYSAAAQVRNELGAIDILVNNAGIVSGRAFLECSDEAIQRTMAINVLALFWTCKAFLPDMIRQQAGHIVTVASAAGTIGVARLVDYCASKWAAVGFDESLRMELHALAPNVKTTIVCPYYIDTGMFAGVHSRFPWLLPILKEDRVAERIVRAIAHNRPRLMMPPIVYLVPLMRVLPVRLFDAISGFLGISQSMNKFTGRSGAHNPSAHEGPTDGKMP
jgi:all-trans-retinol dehydrogenase (NAD+)